MFSCIQGPLQKKIAQISELQEEVQKLKVENSRLRSAHTDSEGTLAHMRSILLPNFAAEISRLQSEVVILQESNSLIALEEEPINASYTQRDIPSDGISDLLDFFFERQKCEFVDSVFNEYAVKVENDTPHLQSQGFQQALLAVGIRHNLSEANALFNEMDLDNNGSLNKEEFRQALARPTKLEQWTSTLQLPAMLASCFPTQDGSVDPLQAITKLTARETQKVAEKMSKGLFRLLWHSLTQLRSSLVEMDKLAPNPQSSSSKFQVVDLIGGNITDFHKGLTGRIGAPHPILTKGMEDEHCAKGGHDKEFTTTNYGVKTTPCKEYHIATGYVVCPDQDLKDKKKERNLRVIKSLEELGRLKVVQDSELVRVEVLAIVLYTGPMFQIYNLILRHHPQAEFVYYKKEGNLFVTTIHVLVSGVIKIARTMKLPAGLKLYRGLGGTLQLPESFWQVDEHACRGYMEWGFLSTTSDKTVAVEYSGAKEGKPIPTVMCMKVGSVDRGAKIADLSQYPQEVEYLWLPCTFLEPEGSPTMELVTDSTGRVMGVVNVIQVRGSTNLKAQTVEELSEQKKNMHLNGFHYMLDELQRELKEEADREHALVRIAADPYAQKPDDDLRKLLEDIIDQCRKVLAQHDKRAPGDYGKDESFRGIVMEMLEVKAMALSKLRCYLLDRSQYIHTYLHKTLRDGHRALVSFLRRKMEGEEGEARRASALELCKLKNLVNEGVEEKNEEGESRLLSAAAEGVSSESLSLLIEAGAKKADLGDALLKAAEFGQRESVSALIEVKAQIDWRRKNKQSALHLASSNGHHSLIELLINSKAEVGAVDEEDRTALFLAAVAGHTSVAQVLIALNADVNAADEEGELPLFWAAFNDHIDVARSLIENQAEVNAAGEDGCTPLWGAATDGRAEVVDMLIEKKADVNAADEVRT